MSIAFKPIVYLRFKTKPGQNDPVLKNVRQNPLLLFGRSVIFGHLIPVDHTPPGRDVIGPAILII